MVKIKDRRRQRLRTSVMNAAPTSFILILERVQWAYRLTRADWRRLLSKSQASKPCQCTLFRLLQYLGDYVLVPDLSKNDKTQNYPSGCYRNSLYTRVCTQREFVIKLEV